MSTVYEDDFCVARCGECNEELLCDGNGNMPDVCPKCGAKLDYSFYNPSYRP